MYPPCLDIPGWETAKGKQMLFDQDRLRIELEAIEAEIGQVVLDRF